MTNTDSVPKEVVTLIADLRKALNSGKGIYGHRVLCGKAANEIEALSGELATSMERTQALCLENTQLRNTIERLQS